MGALPPLVCFAAPSGTGKTTLIEGILHELARRGLRVGVLKHDAHRLVLDRPGKDTWRFRQAGAWRAVIASEDQLGLFTALDGHATVAGLAERWLPGADLVLCEGFRRSGLPLIRVHREAVADPSWEAPSDPIAWVSDAPVDVAVPVLPLGDPAAVARWLVERFLPGGVPVRPTTLALPVDGSVAPDEVARVAARLGPTCDAVLVVHAPGARPPGGLSAVPDLRPGLGPLGGLLTALAVADTPDVVYLGKRYHHVAPSAVRALRTWGPPQADVVVPVDGPHAEPTFARYSHRCLGAIKAALLSGEAKMGSWWGQVRLARIPPSEWRPAVQ